MSNLDYDVSIDGDSGSTNTIQAEDLADAIQQARDWADDGDWSNPAEWAWEQAEHLYPEREILGAAAEVTVVITIENSEETYTETHTVREAVRPVGVPDDAERVSISGRYDSGTPLDTYVWLKNLGV